MPAFGGISFANNATTQAVGTSANKVDDFDTAMASLNVTSSHADDKLTISRAGVYEVEWTLSMKSAADLEVYDVYAVTDPGGVGEAEITGTRQQIELTGASEVVAASGGTFYEFAAADTVGLVQVAGSAGNTVTNVSGSLRVRWIGETS